MKSHFLYILFGVHWPRITIPLWPRLVPVQSFPPRFPAPATIPIRGADGEFVPRGDDGSFFVRILFGDAFDNGDVIG